ncbi:MAG TPA: hypothetical protein VFV99_17965 [Kofleriaceae bacterium]|nr:hypothetical protein [Kofleriaceae bacterium]
MKVVVVLAVLLASAEAFATVGRIDVAVDDTTRVPVGDAIGWFCDDPSLIAASIVTQGTYNEWVVTGAKEGVTQCRIGNVASGRATVFIEVHVLPRSSELRRDKQTSAPTRIAAS